MARTLDIVEGLRTREGIVVVEDGAAADQAGEPLGDRQAASERALGLQFCGARPRAHAPVTTQAWPTRGGGFAARVSRESNPVVTGRCTSRGLPWRRARPGDSAGDPLMTPV